MKAILEKSQTLTEKMQNNRHPDPYEFGGTVKSVRNYQAGFVKYFRGCKRVLDLGCGRGVFLKLLAESGIEGVGVDACAEGIAWCKKQGLENVHQLDVFQYLRALISKDLTESRKDVDGIFCSHLIEHLDFASALKLLDLCYQVLKPKGRMVIITPNPESIQVMGLIFWLDPTHVRPYPLPLLESMLEKSGFKIIDQGSFDSRDQGIRSVYANIWNSLLSLKKIGINAFVVAEKSG
jgi:2-polyprenyl-3-methyl-5-hydroxy-6-metoxy-1,4-benzoquinol methylase